MSTWRKAREEDVARARAAGEQLQVSVDHITIELWTDRDVSLENNQIRVSFMERWKARCCALSRDASSLDLDKALAR